MKFDHILFPIDFSERSRAVNERVEWLAARFGSRVTLLHVFEIPAAWYGACEASFLSMECFDTIRNSAQQRLGEYQINVSGNRLQRVLLQGSAATEILKWAREHEVDLLVMGTHGYGALQGWLLGSVTAKLLHSATCAIWTDCASHSHTDNGPIDKILCAVELTKETVPLLRFTAQLATQLDASVRLIHSVPELETRPAKYFDFDLHQYLMELARVEISKMQRSANTEFPLTISGAGISSAIAEAVGKEGANLIVIGRGKSQKSLGRLQTHTYEIIRNAPCPVLSYSLDQQDQISSFCSAEHRVQSAGSAPLLIGSQQL